MKNKAVDAAGLKNRAARNREARHKVLLRELKLKKDNKGFGAQFNLNVNKVIRENLHQEEEYKKQKDTVAQFNAEEKDKQVTEGVIEKPQRVGRFKY